MAPKRSQSVDLNNAHNYAAFFSRTKLPLTFAANTDAAIDPL
jgi:hypothetical protein